MEVTMIRTQIQLEEEHLNWLRNESKTRGVSISQLIREGISLFKEREERMPADRKARALEAVGRFSSGKSDIAEKHDQYLANAYKD
jgi:hypothetical protein